MSTSQREDRSGAREAASRSGHSARQGEHPSPPLGGLHHVTAIGGDARRNVDFYTRVLGQRLVKRTVNFDDPSTHHLYYGDERGTPGSIMTFFPWPGSRRGRRGAGQVVVTSYGVPPGSLEWWEEHLLSRQVAVEPLARRFGERTLRLLDPDGLLLELVEVAGLEGAAPWTGGGIAPEVAVRGFRGVTVATAPGSGTSSFVEQVMGFEPVAEEGGTRRHRIAPAPGHGPASVHDPFAAVLDVETSEEHGRGGAGTVHHVAFRIADDPAEQAWRSHLLASGAAVSPVMDRQYFHSIYFREPGGVLFEIATDPPGFTLDESVEELGSALRLPPQYESQRERIERLLPPLTEAMPATSRDERSSA
ncbi:MAG: ring-cleaving dioxygenase [Acidobacteria bacterium]|nr:MAG: ring-cleaving dioxygenase [Acidobacteriota bacterium]REK05939.1 MAG: ring-cleaving dioxygenase [Acidobacteriota bacterium]